MGQLGRDLVDCYMNLFPAAFYLPIRSTFLSRREVRTQKPLTHYRFTLRSIFGRWEDTLEHDSAHHISQRIHSSVASQMHTVPPCEADASRFPSGENAAERIAPVCPASVVMEARVLAFQRRIVPSSELETMRVPSGEYATYETDLVWPTSGAPTC